MAAGYLQRAGKQVIVLESTSVIGGRMASLTVPIHDNGERRQPAVFDHGAQYFTVRDHRFKDLVEKWQKLGIVQEWSRGFATADGSYYADGLARYRGDPDMAVVPNYLARTLQVQLSSKVVRINWQQGSWTITISGGRSFRARSLLLSPPVPASLALLDRSQVDLPVAEREALDLLEYEPCLAVLIKVDGMGMLPEPGGMWPVGEPISWMADNYRKGVSPEVGTITIHAGPEFSEHYWKTDDQQIVQALTDAAGRWLGDPVSFSRVYRWPYSKPIRTYSQPYLYLEEPGPLIFAGDAFAGPRVEGAALSGLAAAEQLLAKL